MIILQLAQNLHTQKKFSGEFCKHCNERMTLDSDAQHIKVKRSKTLNFLLHKKVWKTGHQSEQGKQSGQDGGKDNTKSLAAVKNLDKETLAGKLNAKDKDDLAQSKERLNTDS